MSEISRNELLELIPAYVLGALDTDEHTQVQALLADDTEAQLLEQGYRQIEQVLPLTVANRQPSSDLKDRLFQRIHDDEIEPDTIVAFAEKPKEKPKGKPRRYVLPMVAALVVAIVGAIFVLTVLNEPTTPQSVFSNLYGQADSERVYVPASEESPTEGALLISADGEQAVLRVQQLPILEEDQIFQLWIVDDAGVIDGGLYQADENAEVYIVLPIEKPAKTYLRFGMSIEPVGGSPLGNAPTGPRVFGVAVPQDT